MKSVRIAGGLGFYGDSWRPIKASIERGNVQYVASDHLAELTLAILQKDRQRDPNLGYTRDLVPMLFELLPLAVPRGVKFILNAGGLNPMAAREVLLAFLDKSGIYKKFGVKLKVGVVLGDAVLERLDELQSAGVSLAHMDTGEHIAAVRERLLFASAYLGAQPLVEALQAGADIVLAGRVADAALFLAPMVHELGWSWDDWDKVAQGMVVGHLLECSGQATGGNFGGDWRSIPDLAHIGYPIAEVWENSEAVISKAPGTGGRVNFDTLREQLLYEVHDPAHYLTPDVDERNEIYLRVAVRCADRKEAAKLGRLIPPLGLSGPPFIGGVGGMMEPRGLLGIWPTLAPRSIIEEYVHVSVEEP